MIDEPEIVQTKAEPAAVIHVVVPREEIREAMGRAFGELMDVVNAQGISAGLPWFTHHLRMDEKVFDYEIGMRVTKPVTPLGRVEPGELPAARVARALYHGDYEGLEGAWQQLGAWLALQGHTPRGDLWEIYLEGPEAGSDPAKWRTELNQPLKD
jgi:effector-binding domain-containing protein